MTHNAVSWFEIPVTDFDRARTFYGRVFDFEMPTVEMGSNLMGFLLFDQENGGIGGAIVCGDGYVPSEDGTLVYLNGGEDLSSPLARVEEAGGRVLVPKTLIDKEIGYFAVFRDCEGNRVALHSAS